jgi:hypothetical protein
MQDQCNYDNGTSKGCGSDRYQRRDSDRYQQRDSDRRQQRNSDR